MTSPKEMKYRRKNIIQMTCFHKYKVWEAQIHSFKSYVLRTLALYNAGSFKDVVEIPLLCMVLLACGRSLGWKIGGIHLRPLHFDTGEGHPAPSMQTDSSITSSRGQASTSRFTSPK